MTYKYEERTYPHITDEGRTKIMRVMYTLWFDEGKLFEVRNAYGHVVDKKSECWQFFTEKHNKNGKI